jgi:hypothetical protein
MSLSAKEAAAQVGMSKQGIIKAIHMGKISAEKDVHGEWQIEPVELFRVYPPVDTIIHQPESTSLRQHTEVDTPSLQREVELLREMLLDKDDVIADLRTRLDAEADERRRLSMMLTEKHNAAPPEPVIEQPVQRRSWWAKLWSGRA